MPSSSRPQAADYSQVQNNDTDSEEEGSEFRKQSKTKPQSQPPYDPARRNSFVGEDGDPLELEMPVRIAEKTGPVTWKSLPRKSQLAILTLARLSEPLMQSSLRVRIPEILKKNTKVSRLLVIYILPTQVI